VGERDEISATITRIHAAGFDAERRPEAPCGRRCAPRHIRKRPAHPCRADAQSQLN
jgi:hypothetical protein